MKIHKVPHADSGVRAKFAAARREMSAGLIERDDEVDVALTALVANEHPLFVGPPGCGKSLLLDSLLAWAGGNRFSLLMTKFTVPEEVFGPVSLAGLKEDRFVRVTKGKLPEADFAFLDEVFTASSAILNSLLKVLNERVYDNGDGVPARCHCACVSRRATSGCAADKVRSVLSGKPDPAGRRRVKHSAYLGTKGVGGQQHAEKAA